MTCEGTASRPTVGIPLLVNWSVLVIAGVLATDLAVVALPDLADGYSTVEYWIVAVATALALFLSLLTHEMSHSLVARRLGIGVRDITLWLYGGVSTIEGEAHSPNDELKIALAGPAASATIGLGASTIGGALLALNAPRLLAVSAIWLGSMNIVLAVFNLAPAAPLDGGRVLHAVLWRRRGDRTSASISATHAGRVFAWVLVSVGFLEVWFLGSIAGVWLLLLGWFVYNAARAEEQQIFIRSELKDLRVRDVMTPDPVTVSEHVTVDSVLHDYVLRRHCSAFPVVDERGALVGLVTLARMRRVPPHAREMTSAHAIAWPVGTFTVADPDEPLLDVLSRVGSGGDGRVVVVRQDRLVGIISPSDIARLLRVSELRRVA
jgi:Zn-dependent protease/CBS domain-containing protein